MYATCLFCHGALGRNEEIESFPVGRTLAFDGAKGRLWVVCPKCLRWNLSPLEERWEAIEWCERQYRGTTQRVATSEIGFARLRSGLALVRIGKPLRPEFAAWRYGRELAARHRSSWWRRAHRSITEDPMAREIIDAGKLLLTGTLLIEGMLVKELVQLEREERRRRPILGLRAGGKPLELTRADLDEIRLEADPARQWSLRLDRESSRDVALATGPDALPLLGRALTYLNDTGGSTKQVSAAVAKVEYFGGGEGLLHAMAQLGSRKRQPLAEALGYEQRLALEMVAHEEQERLAMEGELAVLAEAWREAETVAAIADDLLTPESILRRIRGARK
jgi:hypothetical protein